MLEATLVFGVIIFLGLATILVKLPLRTSLWLLGHSMALDIGVFITVLVLHWGTMTGVMSATVAALICTVITGVCKRLFGYIRGDMYYPGTINLTTKIMKEE